MPTLSDIHNNYEKKGGKYEPPLAAPIEPAQPVQGFPPVITPPVVPDNPALPSRGTFPPTLILHTDFVHVSVGGHFVRSRMFPIVSNLNE